MLKLLGIVAGGWQLLRSALISQQRLAAGGSLAAGDGEFYKAKISTARFYCDYLLSQAPGLAHGILHGAAGALAEGAL